MILAAKVSIITTDKAFHLMISDTTPTIKIREKVQSKDQTWEDMQYNPSMG